MLTHDAYSSHSPDTSPLIRGQGHDSASLFVARNFFGPFFPLRGRPGAFCFGPPASGMSIALAPSGQRAAIDEVREPENF